MAIAQSPSPTRGVRRSQRLRRLAAFAFGGAPPFGLAGRDWLALNTLGYMGLLLIQFGMGMGLNLFITITQNHPGAGATNVVVDFFDSVVWGIVHGPLILAIHAVLGLPAAFHPALGLLPLSVRWGPRGSVWASAATAVFALGAGISGLAYLAYNQDVYSLLMALGFGGAMLCSAISLYVLSRATGRTAAPPAGTPAR